MARGRLRTRVPPHPVVDEAIPTEPEPNPLSELFRPEPPPSDDGPSLRLGRDCMHLGGLLEITDWPKPYPKP